MYDLISWMLYMYCSSLISLFIIQNGQTCMLCSFGSWMQWGGCSHTCGGGTRERQRIVCCPKKESYAYCINTLCRIANKQIWQSSACNKDCYNGGIFDHNNCKCSPGWQGHCCVEACKYPYFGDSCLQQCDCEHGVCDHVTGKCDCLVGWTGTKCNHDCAYGYFGKDCQQICNCAKGDCHHITGICACFPGWTGRNCSRPCENGYFGNNCQQVCSCENGNCDYITGNCACYTGWTGGNCRKPCAYGYFGNNCQQECSCENGNCDHITGNCACYTGWTGRNCRKPCDYQYFGDDCQEKCECENGICNHVTGNCTCQPGWTGKTCNDTCKHGYFGVGCLEKCTCQNGYCDNESGNCTCEVGWNGLTCEEKIPNSHYGTLFTSTSGGFVGFILMLICLSIISIKLRRAMKQTTTRNTATAPTHTEGVTPHYEYIDIENSNIDNEQTMEQYESLRSSDSYEEMSNYDIIITQSAGCENTININLHQYEPLSGSKKRSHIYSDTRPNDDPEYLEVLG